MSLMFVKRNLKDCIAKLATALEDACIPPTERIMTEPPDYANDARLREKKHRAEIKRGRNFKFTGME
jgi:hypothetical protein